MTALRLCFPSYAWKKTSQSEDSKGAILVINIPFEKGKWRKGNVKNAKYRLFAAADKEKAL